MLLKPEIKSARAILENRWITVREKSLDTGNGSGTQEYYSLACNDYVTIIAMTSDGRIPLVKQFRHAVETFTWELPSGLLEVDEEPAECARKELLEEAGFLADKLEKVGVFFSDVGRIENRVHAFFASDVKPVQNWEAEPGIERHLVTESELDDMIVAGDFIFSIQLGLLLKWKLLQSRTKPDKKNTKYNTD